MGKEAFDLMSQESLHQSQCMLLGSTLTFKFILFPILIRYFIYLDHTVGIFVRYFQLLLKQREVEINK